MNETNLLTIEYNENICPTQSCYKLLSSYTRYLVGNGSTKKLHISVLMNKIGIDSD